MSEEEKNAIKDCDIIFMNLDDMMSEDSANDYRKSYKIIKNLIDKQQKEIIRLNRKQADDEMLKDTFIERDYISRDKIIEKIEELESFDKAMHQKNGQFTILVLKGLLKEN